MMPPDSLGGEQRAHLVDQRRDRRPPCSCSSRSRSAGGRCVPPRTGPAAAAIARDPSSRRLGAATAGRALASSLCSHARANVQSRLTVAARRVQRFGGLLEAQPAEEPAFDDLRLSCVQLFQPAERLAQGNQIVERLFARRRRRLRSAGGSRRPRASQRLGARRDRSARCAWRATRWRRNARGCASRPAPPAGASSRPRAPCPWRPAYVRRVRAGAVRAQSGATPRTHGAATAEARRDPPRHARAGAR